MFHAFGNNPVTYTDPDGRQSSFLPGGGTSFNGPCPNMEYDINEYTEFNKTLGNYVDGVASKSGDFFFSMWMILDKMTGEKYAKATQKFYNKMQTDIIFFKAELKCSGICDFDKDGRYSKEEVKFFANTVNNTIKLNYSNQSDLGPYKIELPLITDSQAELYLNAPTYNCVPKLDQLQKNLED